MKKVHFCREVKMRIELKLAFLTLVTLFAAGCMSTQSWVKNPERLSQINRIAVLPLKSNAPSVGESISDAIAGQLLMSRYTIVERSQLENILSEQNLTMSGILDGQQSFVGKIKNIDALILGSATVSVGFAGVAFGGNVEYVSSSSIRMVDIKTGEVLAVSNFKTDTPNTFSGVATPGKVAEKLAADFIK